MTILETGERWSGAEVNAAAGVKSEQLSGLGIAPGGVVVLTTEQAPSFLADLFGVWRSGCSAVCVAPGVTAGEFARIVEFAEADLVITGEPRLAAVETNVPHLPVAVKGRPAAAKTTPLVSIDADAPALILFTSGTTGEPKGVVLSHGALSARIECNLRHIPAKNLERTLCFLPLHFGHGLIGNALTPLAAGSDLLLCDGGMRPAARLAEIVETHGITFMSSTPAFWRLALRMPPPTSRGRLRQVSIGSAPVSAALAKKVAAWTGIRDIRIMYGITECANWVAGYSLQGRDARDGCVGTPWGGAIRVRDEVGKLHAEGEGEIVVRTPCLMSGYLKRNDLTRAVMADGWYRTGDLGTIREGGEIFVTGRIKDEINRGGVKVSPAEIDALLERHPAVDEACCFSVPDAIAGEIVGTALRIADGRAVDLLDIRDWCAGEIRAECVPDRWFAVSDFPRTDSGKVVRSRVAQACIEGEK